eukprot:3052700-Amphidinium_carterae.1
MSLPLKERLQSSWHISTASNVSVSCFWTFLGSICLRTLRYNLSYLSQQRSRFALKLRPLVRATSLTKDCCQNACQQRDKLARSTGRQVLGVGKRCAAVPAGMRLLR